jgi:uncharacterized protein
MTASSLSRRYLELDALRGFAVMGILLMNIVGFALPEAAYLTPSYAGPPTPSDATSWLVNFVFFDGKMRGLFSLLFGASMMLIAERAMANAESPISVHYRRMVWLALFGLAHYVLLWYGDILFLYAVIGSFAFLMRDWDSERLIRIGLFLYVIGFIAMSAWMGSLIGIQWQVAQGGAGPDLIAQYQEILAEFVPPADELAAQIAHFHGTYADIVWTRGVEEFSYLGVTVLYFLLETLPLMMIGMALYKNGFLTGDWAARDYRRLCLRLVVVGLILQNILALVIVFSQFDVLITVNAVVAWSLPTRLMIAVGYAALLILLIHKSAGQPWLNRVAATGRTAFSNYLMTSVIMTSIFYGYGLGLFGRLDRVELMLVVGFMWSLMLLWSLPWLRRFRYGPLEWLWRSLARGRLEPMRLPVRSPTR